jgi:hypothetical protein
LGEWPHASAGNIHVKPLVIMIGAVIRPTEESRTLRG